VVSEDYDIVVVDVSYFNNDDVSPCLSLSSKSNA